MLLPRLQLRSPAPLLAAVAILGLLTSATPARPAEPFLPLAIGNAWEYRTESGQHELQQVVDRADIFGYDAYVIRYEESTFNDGLENYWTTSEDGDVYLLGFRLQSGAGFLYNPPVKMVDAPLAVGRTWTQAFTIYSIPDTTAGQTFKITFTVHEAPLLDVPAGTFPTYGIGYDAVPSELVTLSVDLSGGFESDARSGPVDWWTQSIGRVQYLTSGTYQLVSFGLPTPTRRCSWGALKYSRRLDPGREDRPRFRH